MRTRSEFSRDFFQLVHDRIGDPTLNGDQLAAGMGMSRMHLHRHLERYFGCSARAMILEIRLQSVYNTLLSSNLPIKTIAEQVGLKDPAYLSRCFRKRFGVPPSKLRAAQEE